MTAATDVMSIRANNQDRRFGKWVTMRDSLSCAVLMMALYMAPAKAEPYLPADDRDVLATLPVSGAERGQLKTLRAALKAQPQRPEPALALAQYYIRLGRAESDPRHFAHAEAVLQPWLDTPKRSPEALVLRATVLQNRHQFGAALTDLSEALRLNPRQAQAWLTLAAVHEAQGNYPAALKSCRLLARFSLGLSGPVCLDSALSLSGQLDSAYARLSARVGNGGADAETLQWAYGILAEMAERLGQVEQAESWYRAALGAGGKSFYLLASYADFLLAQNRPGDVLTLLDGQTGSDPLLLRLTLAEQRLGAAGFGAHAEMLRARFAAAWMRGDTTHQGDEARFALDVERAPERALALAESNWRVQREPRDALILLAAALAARRPEAARPVIDFVRRASLQDRRLQKLSERLEANLPEEEGNSF